MLPSITALAREAESTSANKGSNTAGNARGCVNSMSVTLTVAENAGIELLRRENSRQFDVVKRRQPRSHLRGDEAVNASPAVPSTTVNVAADFVPWRAPVDRQEVDQLDEQLSAAATGPTKTAAVSRRSPRHEAVLADAQQRPARHVQNPGRLHDDRARLVRRRSACTTRSTHRSQSHRRSPAEALRMARHPGTWREEDCRPPEAENRARAGGLFHGRDPALRRREVDTLRRSPHIVLAAVMARVV